MDWYGGVLHSDFFLFSQRLCIPQKSRKILMNQWHGSNWHHCLVMSVHKHTPHICAEAGVNSPVLPVKQEYSIGPVRWLSVQRLLLPSPMTLVQSLGPKGWQEREDSPKLSSDLYNYPVTGGSSHKTSKQCNKNQHSQYSYGELIWISQDEEHFMYHSTAHYILLHYSLCL